jgi:hypothetical protein
MCVINVSLMAWTGRAVKAINSSDGPMAAFKVLIKVDRSLGESTHSSTKYLMSNYVNNSSKNQFCR